MWIRFSLFFGLSSALVNPATDARDRTERINNDSSFLRFGNSAEQYFRLLDLDGAHLLVGARDIVYNISVESFSEIKSIKWSSSEDVIKECLMKGKPKNDCHNFIRVLAKDDEAGILICGTNAFQPLCRVYDREKYGEYRQELEFPGVGISPYDPSYNSSFLRDGDLIYAATVSDFSGADPLIHRRNASNISDLGIRTERTDVKYLNKPQFAGIFSDETYVYVWFREQMVANAGYRRMMRSRIARLCRSDNGGPRSYSFEWTSFVKADLNCSIPGNYPFYFDQIEAISTVVQINSTDGSEKRSKLVYAVFSSPLSGITSSAICAFNLTHIEEVFAKSTFRRQINSHSWPSTITDSKIRPGKCVNDSRSLNEETVAFLRANPLMDDSIQNHYESPLSIYSREDHFTQIAVDPQVKALDGRYYDILYVATDKGSVLKIVNLAILLNKTEPSHHILTINVTCESIRNMMLYNSKKGKVNERYVIVVTDSSVWRIPAVQCGRFKTCSACISLRDPHCAWDRQTDQCISPSDFSENYRQDIVKGQAFEICEETEHFQSSSISAEAVPSLTKVDKVDIDYNQIHSAKFTRDPLSVNKIENEPCVCDNRMAIENCQPNTISSEISSESASTIYKSETNVLILCSGTAMLALLLGFLVGSLCSYWRVPSKDQISLCGSLRQSPQPVLAGTLPSYSVKSVINAYETTSTGRTMDSPLPLQVECLSNQLNERVAWGTSTLPRNYRVRQVYL